MKTFLYHYCNNYAFENIIKKRQLWMTDIVNSNDFNEARLFWPRILQVADELYRKEPFEFRLKRERNYDAIQLLLDEAFRRVNISYNSGMLTSFVSCFCEIGDVLSQWRGYAKDGCGCSLGFSLDEMLRYCESTNGVIKLVKVEYIPSDDLDDIVYEEAKNALEKIKELREDAEQLVTSDIANESLEDLMSVMFYGYIEKVMIDSLKYKIYAFHEELEWRLIFGDVSKDEKLLFSGSETSGDGKSYDNILKYDNSAKMLMNRVDFTFKDDNIIPYYPIDLMEISQKPIKEIILGPKNKSSKHDVELFSTKYGFNDVC